ncbi:DNA mismatch repair protein MutT [Candidatus Kaiserbacteria bacterium CG10_big_fil_rev_8_21_14_0_10_49_17]|uniref:Oxidized purine nucleoside triphosphate hydrolase n=1 Tax=Candidatus Kaiserbacteria bacterium CG10_big_fil_rev_8_21_14_0_10_49_17 TaxID=1974609 RepID=A0A2M6WE60_9BACT|nr:MAG: DNA mismatch repair protein MutT [Candidatus Kaiserbacteria bacterium CG10_big_fil_rev_8_21_14_0_10_49_17]
MEAIMKSATLCFPLRNDGMEILLGIKAEKIGAGLWNGYGGKIEGGERPAQAAVRELFQECGIRTDEHALERVAALQFYFDAIPSFFVHVFFVPVWSGTPVETREMKTPRWFSVKGLPWDRMMSSDRVWLKKILEGKKFLSAHVHYHTEQTPDGDAVLHFDRLVEDRVLRSL